MQGDGAAAIPHLSVPNISHVDWRALKGAGFQGCVFDKDNTLTEPYAIAIAPILVNSLKRCIETFGGDNVVLLSNSAGLEEFDPEGKPPIQASSVLLPTVHFNIAVRKLALEDTHHPGSNRYRIAVSFK